MRLEAVSSLGFLFCLIYPRHGAQGASNLGTLMYTCRLRSFSRVQLFVIPWTAARQAPLSLGFSRQEYWNGLPFPPLGDFPDPGIKPGSLISPVLAGGFFTTSATWELQAWYFQPYSAPEVEGLWPRLVPWDCLSHSEWPRKWALIQSKWTF